MQRNRKLYPVSWKKKKKSLKTLWGGLDVGLHCLSPSLPHTSVPKFQGRVWWGQGSTLILLTMREMWVRGGKETNISAGRNCLPGWGSVPREKRGHWFQHCINWDIFIILRVWAKTHLKRAGLNWKWIGALLRGAGEDRETDLQKQRKEIISWS